MSVLWLAVAILQTLLEGRVAAGFSACGRRLEFEKRTADLEVDFAGVQEGRQRSSATRQAFCGVSCCGPTQAWPRGLDTSCARFHTETHHHSAVTLEKIGGSSSQEKLSARSDSVARAPGYSNFVDQEPGFAVVGAHAPGIRLATRRGSWEMSMEHVHVFWWRPCTCRSHKQKCNNKTIGPGSLRREPNIASTLWALRRQRSPRYTLVLPLTPFFRQRAFNCCNYQSLSYKYRPAICDRQLLAQESVQCLLQQWWQATPLPPTGLTPNRSEALLAKWMRYRLRCVAPQQTETETTLDG